MMNQSQAQGPSARWLVFAAVAAVLAVVLLGAILVYVVTAQGDLDSLRVENLALAAKLDGQSATGALSQETLAQLSQAVVGSVKQQGDALASSQADLEGLRRASERLYAKLDEQTEAVALNQTSLDEVREVNRSLGPTIDAQSDALAATQAATQASLSQLQEEIRAFAAKQEEQSAVLALSQQELTELRRANETLTSRLGGQTDTMTSSQDALRELRQSNENLTALMGDQNKALAKSQSDIEKLGEQTLVLAALQSDIETLRRENQDLTTMVNIQQVYAYVEALPASNKYVLNPTRDSPTAYGMLLTNVHDRFGVATLIGVDPLDPGMVYQLWLEKNGVPVSAGLISKIDPETRFGQVSISEFPEPVSQFDRMFVTLEAEPGSPSPTGPALLLASKGQSDGSDDDDGW